MTKIRKEQINDYVSTATQTLLDSKVAGAGTVTVGRIARFTGTDGVTIGQTTGLYEDASGNLGIGMAAPTATIHLKAGTASTAPSFNPAFARRRLLS